jgi:hypothetical protein
MSAPNLTQRIHKPIKIPILRPYRKQENMGLLFTLNHRGFCFSGVVGPFSAYAGRIQELKNGTQWRGRPSV